jgi:c-di-GMP-binding flagellar brake protein YcgR
VVTLPDIFARLEWASVNNPKLQPDFLAHLLEDPSEVRRWTRYKIDVRIKVTVNTVPGVTTAMYGRGSDISEGGMIAYIPSALRIGAKVQLELTFPGATNAVTLRAVVRNGGGFSFGLEFLDLEDAVRKMIIHACKSLSPIQ